MLKGKAQLNFTPKITSMQYSHHSWKIIKKGLLDKKAKVFFSDWQLFQTNYNLGPHITTFKNGTNCSQTSKSICVSLNFVDRKKPRKQFIVNVLS